MSFIDHGVNRKVIDNVENYLNLKFQPNVTKRLRIWLKPNFVFFSRKSGLVTFLYLYWSSYMEYSRKTCCKKNKNRKSNDWKYEDFCH